MRSIFPRVQRFLLLGWLLLWAGCYTNPVTGRQYAVMTSVGEELQLGVQAFTAVKQAETISRDPSANARIQKIGRRIAAAVGDQLPGAQWEFVVFESDELNAFALPGGKVGVYSGLMKLLSSDDELAAVMGHEIGHVVARHGGKRMTEATLIGLVGTAGAIAMDNKYGSEKRDLFLLAYGGISTVGYVLPHSRGDESEADLMGLQYAAQAGYNPYAAISLWEKMGAASGRSNVPAWLSTHPSNARRIADLRAAVPRFTALYQANRGRY
ncbi:MAG: M48 family metallopeptidase [Cephaloticoccus sp.]|nr:M48 family metallopeptidase [Cephaloticoccus sp.]MCF7759900.1 M48 family metallopeptidase [Cephaloticoccus sp.]